MRGQVNISIDSNTLRECKIDSEHDLISPGSSNVSLSNLDNKRIPNKYLHNIEASESSKSFRPLRHTQAWECHVPQDLSSQVCSSAPFSKLIGRPLAALSLMPSITHSHALAHALTQIFESALAVAVREINQIRRHVLDV
jgi:hypothetical protein